MRDALRVGGDVAELRVTSEQSDGALVAYEVTIPPGGGPPHLHSHEAFELFRVESGELAFYLVDEGDGGEPRRSLAGPGAVVAVPSGRQHTVRNESADEARAFAVLSPGAEMERFMRSLGEPA